MVQAWDEALRPFDQDEEEQVERAIKINKIKKPEMPTQKEIDEHMITHTPFRAWCPHCVAGHSSCGYHLRKKDDQKEENSLPTVHMDYMYMKSEKKEEVTDEEEHDSMPILVMCDQKTDMMFSSLVPKKGAHAYAIMRVCNDLSLLGHERVVLRSDGEPALRSLKEAVQADSSMKIELTGRRGDKREQVAKEESCAYDSRTNGFIESRIRRVQGQIRAMKDALESRL